MTGTRCGRGTCPGVLEDGFCSICGLAEPRPEPRPASAQAGLEIAGNGATAELAPTTRSTPFSRAAAGAQRARHRSRRTGRKQMGAGLISLPDLPSVEPEQAVLQEPTVPEHKRFCAKCEAALRREAGFCGKCGTRYSFVPTLRAGDVVAEQYEVRGPIAFGGLGWIYLAYDRLLRRYVVLKGMLNAQDTAAATVAVAERQFLAAVKHPNIVAIYNFVQFGGEGFIVMEYVGGKTLKQLRQERGPLPPAEALAYIHRILPAFAYLHRMGLVFCDFKPDNVMLEMDDVKLIDLGGVRRVDDPGGDIYGTVGYSAPEAGAGPTAASDLYTVGRTLAVLLMDIGSFGKKHRYTLPSPEEKPLLAEQESLHRLLLKATAELPDDRFETAEEMAEQMWGVLREVVARSTGEPQPGGSPEFGGDLLALETTEAIGPVLPEPRFLPVPTPESHDPGAQAVGTALALPTPGQRLNALRTAAQQLPGSREARLRLAGALTDAGELGEADALLRGLEAEDAWNWRALWFRGRLCLRGGDARGAWKLFDQLYFDLPGELPPKLALALAAELAGNLGYAARLYDLVARVDPVLVSAIFGLARCLRLQGKSKAAVEVLQRVAPTSALYPRAQAEAIRLLLGPRLHAPPLDDLLAAAALAESLPLEGRNRFALQREVFQAAVRELHRQGTKATSNRTLLGTPLQERPLRLALEQALRGLARFADGDERVRLIDEANQARPRSVV